jgi:hypothetical protein
MIRLLSVCAFLLLSLHARAELISTGVGMVRGQVVTSREVQIQNLLETALYDSKTPPAKVRLPGLDSKAFNKATQDVLLETVVAMEAHNFNVIQISSEEIEEAKKKALKYLKATPPWAGLQVSARELDNGLHRKI